LVGKEVYLLVQLQHRVVQRTALILRCGGDSDSVTGKGDNGDWRRRWLAVTSE